MAAAGSPLMRLRDREWYTPISKDYVDPGDRFIPTRSLMNLGRARCWLTEKRAKMASSDERPAILSARDEYRRRVLENLMLEPDGKPFKMLAFRGFPRRRKPSLLLVDEMNQEQEKPAPRIRHIQKHADRVLDAPKLVNDYYLNLIDWGKSNILAVALGPSLYLWNAKNGVVQLLLRADEVDHPTSVAWSRDGKMLGVGFASSKIELWDGIALKQVRILEGHKDRVGSLCWNEKVLTSGSRDKYIINHDVRSHGSASYLKGHSDEVCGLRWSRHGDMLASGGNDNLVHVWDSVKMGSSKYLHRFTDHCAAVRALAWCPFQQNTLASGGGTADKCIKIWNTNSGKCTISIDTNAQVCALEWNRHQQEILSAHGYTQNQLSLWSYPSMSKITDLNGHTGRVLHLSQSPDGSTVISAAADETLRFWKVFEPPQHSSWASYDEDLLSPKRMHIR